MALAAINNLARKIAPGARGWVCGINKSAIHLAEDILAVFEDGDFEVAPLTRVAAPIRRGGIPVNLAVLPVALHGLGGVGKSQTVIEYIYRHVREYGKFLRPLWEEHGLRSQRPHWPTTSDNPCLVRYATGQS